MKYTFQLTRRLAADLVRLPEPHVDRLDDFIELYEQFGLSDHTKYPGRLSPSWHRLPTNHANCVHATKYSLWHYHMGHPHYAGGSSNADGSKWGQTSQYLIHFRWVGGGAHIDIVDLYTHDNSSGQFYIPSLKTIDPQQETENSPPDTQIVKGEAPANKNAAG